VDGENQLLQPKQNNPLHFWPPDPPTLPSQTMSEAGSRRTSLRLFGTPNASEQTTPMKRLSEANENDLFGFKRQRRSSVVRFLRMKFGGINCNKIPGKSILKSPARGAKSPGRFVNIGNMPGSALRDAPKYVYFTNDLLGKRSTEKKLPRKSLGRRVSFAQTAHIRLFEKDHEYSPEKSRESFGLEEPSGFQIPDLSSVRRGSNAYNLRLSLPKEDITVDSEESYDIQ
jgi:hypothetical protein